MDMGFTEMPTNKWVESAFWNFDSLFQPQSHPARDAHDTFFMKSPAAANSVPEEYYEVGNALFIFEIFIAVFVSIGFCQLFQNVMFFLFFKMSCFFASLFV